MAVHLIINRQARRLRSGRLLAELRRERAGVRVIETRSLGDLDAAAGDVAAAKAGNTTAVILAGGDGSYMAGVTALTHAFKGSSLPPIALAPGGTVCTVARASAYGGMRGDPILYAERLLHAIATDGAVRSTPRPTLRVIGDGGETRIAFIFGAGLVARFFELYEAGGARGNAAAARIVARVFAGSFVRSRFARSILDPSPCAIEIDGVSSFDEVSLLCAGVVRDLGLHLHLLHRAAEETDRFHVVATPLPPHALGPQLPLVLAGRSLIGPRADALAKHLTLRFPKGEGAYVLDGDLFRADTIDVTAGPVLDVLSLAP